MEGNYLFEKFCNEHGYKSSMSALQLETNIKDQAKLDEQWDFICQQYEAYQDGVWLIVVADVNLQTDINLELSRHAVINFWKDTVLHVPYEQRMFVQELIDGLTHRGTITPKSFGGHIKKG